MEAIARKSGQKSWLSKKRPFTSFIVVTDALMATIGIFLLGGVLGSTNIKTL